MPLYMLREGSINRCCYTSAQLILFMRTARGINRFPSIEGPPAKSNFEISEVSFCHAAYFTISSTASIMERLCIYGFVTVSQIHAAIQCSTNLIHAHYQRHKTFPALAWPPVKSYFLIRQFLFRHTDNFTISLTASIMKLLCLYHSALAT